MALVCSHNGNSCNLPTTGASSVPDSLISYIASLRIKPPSGHSLPCKATHQVTRGPHGQLWGVSCSTPAHAKPCAESQSSRVVYGHLYDHRTSEYVSATRKEEIVPCPLNSPGAQTQCQQAAGLMKGRHISASLAFLTQSLILVTLVKEI